MRRASSWTQRAEVRALAERGLSVREIAARVFGDRRLKGRVERILAQAPTPIERVQAELAAFALERGVPIQADEPIAGRRRRRPRRRRHDGHRRQPGDELDELIASLEAGGGALDELIAHLETDFPELDA